MSDVFLSYSREDQAIARRYAEALKGEGFTVWWDAALNPGETFDQVTEQALEEAGAVVVLWSKNSVKSRWVRSEATQADRYGTLVPVMIEPCNRPIMFELSHTADMSGWKGDTADPVWRGIMAGVRRLVDKRVLSGGTAATAAAAGVLPQARSWMPLAAAAAAALLLAAGGWWLLHGRDAVTPATAVPGAVRETAATPAVPLESIAVMPFENRSGDPEKNYFAEGITEELINALTKVQGLKVASRTSTFAYKGRNADVRQIAGELGVAAVIEGSLRSAGDTVRLTATLSNAATGFQLWSETYERDFKDLFLLQDELTREIVTAYSRTMGVGQLGFVSGGPPTRSLDAYVLFMRSQYADESGSDEGQRQAVEYARQALALDPDFAAAHRALADAASNLDGAASLEEAERHARRADELQPPLGRDVLIGIKARRGRWIEAEELFRSMPQDPGDPGVLAFHAFGVLWPTGKMQEALRESARSVALAPAAPNLASILARLHAALGQEAEALQWAQTAASLGTDASGRRNRQVYYENAIHARRFDEAAGIFMEFLPASLRTPQGETAVRQVHAGIADPAHRSAGVAAVTALLANPSTSGLVMEVFALRWYSQLGALDEAFALAEKTLQGFGEITSFGAWAWLWSYDMAPFRRDPRFSSFVTKLGLTPYWEKFGPPDGCTLDAGRLSCR